MTSRSAIAPLKLPLLPIEIVVMIAHELGNDVFRLRKEKLYAPIDVSLDIILYNAIVSYESHGQCSSIRRPLQELGRVGDPGIKQEMTEREALLWQHTNGCPKKLIASVELYDDEMWSPVMLRYGYLVYGEGEELVIHDLVRRTQWKTARDPSMRIAITNTRIIFATVRKMHYYSMDRLRGLSHADSIDDIAETMTSLGDAVPSSLRGYIDAIAGHGETVVILSIRDGWKSLCFWRDGLFKLIESVHVDRGREALCNALDVQSDTVVHAYLKRSLEGIELMIDRYSMDGDFLKRNGISLLGEPHALQLNYTGTGKWCVTSLDKERCEPWTFIVDTENEQSFSSVAFLWKDVLYAAELAHLEAKPWQGNLHYHDGMSRFLGVLRGPIPSATCKNNIYGLHVDDSFLMIKQYDDAETIKWSLFTFDDLPGRAVTTEPVGDRFYWDPHLFSEEPAAWKWYDD